MTDETATNCQTCGKPLQKGGSMTQWIFDTSTCTCSEGAPSAVVQPPHCALCGLVIKTKLGSITHWIFKTPVCECLSTDAVDKALFDSAQLPKDDSIAGAPYEFLGVTGSGGNATVYKARNRKLGRYVAIKILKAGPDGSRAVQNFLREATSASKLQHPNIVTVQDFGQMSDGRKFLVTEWIEGITLADYLQKHARLSLEATKELFSQVLDGLAHAHNRAVIHRDIKPSNIMLVRGASGGWTVKIIDFGTAKDIDKDQEKTRAEDMAGSPFYMSPEQATGETVDARADLYSLGCTMFEALTGRAPFVGKALSVVMRHQLEEPPTLEIASGGLDFPQSIEGIVAKLLAKSPSERFQTASEVKVALQSASFERRLAFNRAPTQSLVQAASNPRGGSLFGSSSPYLIAGALVAGLVFSTLGGLFLQSFSNLPSPNKVPTKGQGESDASQVLETQMDGALSRIRDSWQDSYRRAEIPLPITSTLAELPKASVHTLSIGEDKEANRNLLGIANLKNLKKLYLHNMQIKAADIDQIARLEQLELLSFNDCNLPPGVLDPLSKSRSLTMLEFRGAQLARDNLQVLPRIQSLQWITLEAIADISDRRALEPLGRVKSLAFLCLHQIPVDDESVKALTSLSNLKVLLLDVTRLTDKGCKEVAKLKALRTFSYALGEGVISDAGIRDLCALPELRSLDIRGSQITDAGLMMLVKTKQLRMLNVAGCKKVTDSGVAHFKELRPGVNVQYGETVLGIQDVLPTDEDLNRQ